MTASVTKIVRASGPDAKTQLCVYRATTAIFGDIEIETMCGLTEMSNLYLVHPWIRPLLDQDFSHNMDRSNEAVRALRLLARLRQLFGALLFRKVSRVETISASQRTV